MTLNGAITELVMLSEHPMMPAVFKPSIQKIIETISEWEEPERKTDIIQKFHDYQVEWLKSHYDIELEPQLEEMIVRFLHDTANCYMMEVENERTYM